MLRDLALQAGRSLLYYVGLVLMARLAGKRLAGQTTTFDLIILITLAVTLQGIALPVGAGPLMALVFVITVFAAHQALTVATARSRPVRRMVRGAPRPIVWDGKVLEDALVAEKMSYEELLAGLRKLGYASPERIRCAILEETGHITAIPKED